MARIRSVKPEIRRSLTVSEWPHSVRLAWIYLWMYLDDAGRGLDDMRLIVAELFPLDRDVSENKMNRWLSLMATTKTAENDVPPLCRYEVQGRRYLHATGWQHQKINRPQPSRLPPCPVHESLSESRTESISDASRNDSRNDSLLDSPPSRAPADQGSGIRDQGSGIREEVGQDLRGGRSETLRPATATKPPPNDEQCSRHPDGNPTDEPCRGCQRVEERKARRGDRAAEQTARAAERAARACTRCDGSWVIDDDTKLPTRRKCDHQSARSLA